MISASPGGLGGFLDKLKSAGLTSEVASWLGPPGRRPDRRGQVDRALGATALSGIAERLGLAQGAVSTAIGYALPKIVGILTPGGAVPAGIPAEVTGFLSPPRGGGGGAGGAHADRRSSGERCERTRDPALALAGARRAGRRRRAVLFLVDAEPDTARSARRQGARAGDARAATVAQAPPRRPRQWRKRQIRRLPRQRLRRPPRRPRAASTDAAGDGASPRDHDCARRLP